ncbi:hypothetical protein ABPG75_004839 [Micractinium tetrahymenae]
MTGSALVCDWRMVTALACFAARSPFTSSCHLSPSGSMLACWKVDAYLVLLTRHLRRALGQLHAVEGFKQKRRQQVQMPASPTSMPPDSTRKAAAAMRRWKRQHCAAAGQFLHHPLHPLAALHLVAAGAAHQLVGALLHVAGHRPGSPVLLQVCHHLGPAAVLVVHGLQLRQGRAMSAGSGSSTEGGPWRRRS